MTEEELHNLRLECYVDPILYARTFKRKAFKFPMSWVHRGILAILLRKCDFLLNFGPEDWPAAKWEWDAKQLEKILKYFTYKVDYDDPFEEPRPIFQWDKETNSISMLASRFVVLMLPRGVGKTTVVNLATEISIVYKDVKFPCYVSETAGHSTEQLDNIKREIEDNELLIAVFGQLKGDRASGLSWTEDYIELQNGVVAVAKGRGGQIRGLNVNFQRPDDIKVDDVEDDESVSTEDQLLKARKWFFKSLVPALPQMEEEGEEGRITVLGTLLHPQALLMTLVKDPEWIAVVFGALDPEGEPIAPFYMTKEQYDLKRLAYARRGMLLEFEMEYNSRVFQDDETRKFDPSKIKIQIMERAQFLAVSEVIDPAISEDKAAAYCALGVVGIEPSGHLHVLDFWAKIGAHPREQVDIYFDKHFQWEPTHHGVEAIAYQQALVHLIQEEMFRRAKVWGTRAYFEVIKETKRLHGTEKNKILRVEGMLSPRYKAKYISHQQHFPVLITQFNDWPLGKKDGPDVIAMCVALLDPFAALAGSDATEDGKSIFAKNSYLPLEEELGNFRAAP